MDILVQLLKKDSTSQFTFLLLHLIDLYSSKKMNELLVYRVYRGLMQTDGLPTAKYKQIDHMEFLSLFFQI